MGDSVKIVFFELEGWEKARIESALGSSGRELLMLDTPFFPKQVKDLKDCEVLSPFIYSQLDSAALKALPALKLVATRSTGFDHIDLTESKARGVLVSNVPEYGSNTVAEHTFALILGLSRKLSVSQAHSRRGHVEVRELRGFDLRGKTLGLVGVGKIGAHVAQIARSFGMEVLAFDPFQVNYVADILRFRYVAFEEVLEKSDIVSLHCPATEKNRHLIGERELEKMKKGSLLINTARGSLVDTKALLMALQSGHLSGAGLDVLEGEEIVKEEAQLLSNDFPRQALEQVLQAHLLSQRPDVIITPHNAFNSGEAVGRILETTLGNILSYLEGKPRNLIG